MRADQIGLLNTGLPVALLIALAWVFPRLLTGSEIRSQSRLAAAVVATALATLLAGAFVFAATYALRGSDVISAVADNLAATLLFFGRLSCLAALAWGPVLVLNWLVMATALESRKGQDLVRRDMGRSNGESS